MIEQRFERSYYVVDPDEADRIGLTAIPWYAMPVVQNGVLCTCITGFPEAVNILARAGLHEPVPEAELDWALEHVGVFEGEPADWIRDRR